MSLLSLLVPRIHTRRLTGKGYSVVPTFEESFNVMMCKLIDFLTKKQEAYTESIPPHHLQAFVGELISFLSSLTTPALLINPKIFSLFLSLNSPFVNPSRKTTCNLACLCSLIPCRARPLISIRLMACPFDTHVSAVIVSVSACDQDVNNIPLLVATHQPPTSHHSTLYQPRDSSPTPTCSLSSLYPLASR
jgi:hypothetical protein